VKPLKNTEFGREFDRFKRSAQRLEVLQHFDVPEEADQFARWQRGEPVTFGPDEWTERIAHDTRAGKLWQRVRVVVDQTAPYIRFEFAALAPSVEAGEDIRVYTPRVVDVADSMRDAWIFDGTRVVLMDYTPAGVWLGARLAEPRDMEAAAKAIADYTYALQHSTPLRAVPAA
jgi:hypothetical protein